MKLNSKGKALFDNTGTVKIQRKLTSTDEIIIGIRSRNDKVSILK